MDERELEALKEQVRDALGELDFVTDDRAQGFIEYVVLTSLVLFAATAAYGLFRAIRTRYQVATGRLNSLPYQ